jgi:hypothetical protein
MVQGLGIARQNFPLGEGMYSTGALVEKAGDEDFKRKYRLSVIEYKTTDSFFAALFIELGILGTLVLVAMFIWLYARARVAPLRYLIILFLLTGYSNADILSMVSPESIVCFLLVGVSFHYGTALQRPRLYAAKEEKMLQLLGRGRRQHAVKRSALVTRRLWAGTG